MTESIAARATCAMAALLLTASPAVAQEAAAPAAAQEAATPAAAQEAATPAAARRTPVHKGFWISFGFGGGTAFGDDAFDGDSKFGGAAFLTMGGTLSQQWLIGGEMIGWGTDSDNVQIGRGAVMFTALYYPSETGGFYVKGGAGFAGRTAETTIFLAGGVEAKVTDDTGGVAVGAGAGYDIQLARNFFITPALDFVYTGTEGDGASLLLFTVGATWR